ncbi:MAG TPA: hypothetical protein VHQ92_13445 [Pseudolabrys sp.]|nr:hypothetical protein [Pseudolabrys sp.]
MPQAAIGGAEDVPAPLAANWAGAQIGAAVYRFADDLLDLAAFDCVILVAV